MTLICKKGKSRVAFARVRLCKSTGHVLAAWGPDLDVGVGDSPHVHRRQLHGLAHSHREGLEGGGTDIGDSWTISGIDLTGEY